ncbi:MAG: 2-oxo acid dehydrogenase subunit E2 [bacterium]|jgi:pyruvate dehydrogenase E2 component (dihydrolipoamide acetyltransferase)|nr:2-oxo acid dehydrogenase subunit E2 [bacterium]
MSRKVDLKYNTPWRRSATAIYKKAVDGRIYGTFEVEMDPAIKYINKFKEKGTRITITQLVIAAIGRALALDIPDTNAYISRGNIFRRKNVGIFTTVNKGGKNEMGGFVIRNVENKSIFDISKEMDERVEKAREHGNDEGAAQKKNLLAALPWPLRDWLFAFARWWHIILGKELKSLNLTYDAFGSAMVTNIGTHDLQFGFPALMPIANIPLVIAIGKIEERPVVRDGEIVIRSIMPVAATLDHRLFDGAQGGILATAARGYILKPECMEIPAAEFMDKG